MDGLKWIKIVTDIFDDEKILLIEQLPDADSIIVIWFKLLCLAGKQNNSGVIIVGRLPCTDEMLAAIFRRPINTVKLALSTFESLGMIEVVNNCITIPKWSVHQELDKLEERRDYMREYMQEYRKKQKMLAGGSKEDVNVYEVNAVNFGKANVNTQTRQDKSKQDKTKQDKRFTPPTLDEVKAYCQERGNNVDAERWMNFYESNGWKVGRNPMKSWQAAVRTWERNGVGGSQKPEAKTNPALSYDQRSYDDNEFQSGDYMREAAEFMKQMNG